MAARSRPSTSYTSATTSYPSRPHDESSASRPGTSMSRPTTSRPRTARPRTAASTIGSDQQIVCAISESRGLSPIVGLAFVNLSTTEAVLCQISDNQTYVKTIHKLQCFDPTEILVMTTAAQPKSKLYSFIEGNLPYIRINPIDRKYWTETTGMEYIQQLAFKQDLEALKVAVEGNYYAICCIAAVLKYIELSLLFTFPIHSLRITYQPADGAMMTDLSTIHALEFIQNLQNAKSKDCLFGLLNQTQTAMGVRLLKSNVVQPLTDAAYLTKRYDALDELTTREDVFFAVRQGMARSSRWRVNGSLTILIALKAFVDVDKVLTAITLIPTRPSIQHSEQSINNVILLKQYVKSIPPIYEALETARSELLVEIFQLCSPNNYVDVEALIDSTINEDITYQSQPLDLRNQRTYAVKSGVNGLLDVARQTYKEANSDAYQLVTGLGETYEIALEMKYDTARQFYIRIATSELEERNLPDVFVNVFKKRNMIECQTLDLLKWNQKIVDSHHEVLQMSDRSIRNLIESLRAEIAPLFKISDAIALLDVTAAFAQLVTIQDYCRPELTQTLAIKSGRHPIREKIHKEKYVPNDAYATRQSRFQIITGCNMSGKSTYIRSIALMAVMAQIGCFVPASYASFPVFHQLFARVSIDDSIEANVSTFAAEMRETAFILRNIDDRSMVIVDELGRGTSTRDGLSIAIAVAEALVDSGAFIWFATHFRDLAAILAERSGVVSLHLSVDMTEADKMKMLYRVASGAVQEEHYGLALAKVINLPPDVLRVAEHVSKKLTSNIEQRKKTSKTVALVRRRKLILSLREQLVQAHEGSMNGNVLATWLQKLQDEFVNRMAAIDADAAEAMEESGGEEDAEMEERVEGYDDDGVGEGGGDGSGGSGSGIGGSTIEKDESNGNRAGSAEQRYEMTGALQSETGEES